MALFDFFSSIIYQVAKITPLNILEMLIAHHTPFNPRLVAESMSAPGILRALNTIPIMDGGTVFPSPLNAPAVVSSMHIKS